MSRMKQFKLPDLGEGLTEGEILKWLVAPGDEVKLNQPTVDVETPIITFDTEPGAGPAPSEGDGATELESAPPSSETVASVEKAGDEEAVEPGMIGGPAPGGRIAV